MEIEIVGIRMAECHHSLIERFANIVDKTMYSKITVGYLYGGKEAVIWLHHRIYSTVTSRTFVNRWEMFGWLAGAYEHSRNIITL